MEKLELDEKYILKSMISLGHKYDTYKIFTDFVTMVAITINNRLNYSGEKEQQYLKIINQYTEEEQQIFIKMFASLINGLDNVQFNDVLGKVYEELNLSNKFKGQFFTPPHLCDLMAKITLDKDVKEQIKNKGYTSVSDPACGSGRLLYSYLKEMYLNNIDYSKKVYVEAQDVSELCCYMTYIQLSLYGANGKVVIGNTLSNEIRDVLYTPFYLIFPIKEKI